MVNQFGTINRNRELKVWVSKLATLIMISTVMTAAAAVLMDEDLVCSVQVDQRSSADRLAAIDRTLQGWSFAVLTSEESSIFVTKYGEVSLMSGIRGTTSAANICGKNGHLYIPNNMKEIDEITELSKNNIYLGRQLVWQVNQPAADGIFPVMKLLSDVLASKRKIHLTALVQPQL